MVLTPIGPDVPSTQNVIGSAACRAPAPVNALAAFFAADPGTRGLDTRVSNVAKRTDVPPSPPIHSRIPGSPVVSSDPDEAPEPRVDELKA